jgi:hypothetical protein
MRTILMRWQVLGVTAAGQAPPQRHLLSCCSASLLQVLGVTPQRQLTRTAVQM